MTIEINQLLSGQYQDFNKVFVKERPSNQEEREKVTELLIVLKEQMEETARNATAFPDKIQSREQLSQRLSAKISSLFNDIKGQPLSRPSQPAPSRTAPTLYAGFHNLSANCWINALLQMLLHTPEGVAILRTVGEYYATGKDLETAHVTACIRYCQADIPASTKRAEAAVKFFCAIQSGYQRLRALETLCSSKADAGLIEHLIRFLPKRNQEQLEKVRTGIDLHRALNLLLADREG